MSQKPNNYECEGQLSLLEIPSTYSFTSIDDPYWDELEAEPSPCESVGEQVQKDTKKSAHQHEKQITQWVERYWVERGINKYWYFRFTWMDNLRKLHRRYLGSVNSPRAISLKHLIKSKIEEGRSPSEIIQIIKAYNGLAQKPKP